jgi:malonyl-CoA O-methyltransferase
MLVSNLAYQWAEDLPRAFSEARRVMKPGGILACTLFGYNTCYELFQSLDEAGSKAQFSRLPDRSQIAEALVSGGFKTTRVEIEFVKISFDGMHGLMAWFKSIGADNLSRKGFLGARAVSRAAAIYSERFAYLQGVAATFEVIRVYAKS